MAIAACLEAPATSGEFAIERVPPDDYRILAIDEAGMDRGGFYWQSPDFLREYEIQGEQVTVDPATRVVISSEVILLRRRALGCQKSANRG